MYEQAREAALANLNAGLADDSDSVFLEEHTEISNAGWVFYYQSARFIRTGDVRDSLVGNASYDPEFFKGD
jgi:hypothetical protein